MAAEVKEVLDRFVVVRRKMGDTIGAAFTTSGDQSGGKETTLMSIIQTLLHKLFSSLQHFVSTVSI